MPPFKIGHLALRRVFGLIGLATIAHLFTCTPGLQDPALDVPTQVITPTKPALPTRVFEG
jgi:hypothetical protein